MKPYSSIESVYQRDRETNRLDTSVLRQDVHRAIGTWVLTEKVDGTNIRVIYQQGKVLVRGRTDKAQLNHTLIEAVLRDTPTYEQVDEMFDLGQSRTVTLYGEGYGAGIQKGGGRYRDDKGFILFDVRITNDEHGSDYFLSWDNVEGIADKLNIPIVPVVGVIEGEEYLPRTRDDLLGWLPYSIVARKHKEHMVEAEGVVAKPLFELSDQYGNRVMWKLCFRDVK